MPEGKRLLTSSTAPAPIGGWDPSLIFASNQRAFDCWMRGFTALTAEMTQFIQARLQADMGTWTTLASCKDMTQAFECQRQYAGKMASDYMEEANKLSRLTMGLANEGLAELQRQASGAATKEAA